jgi:hypothetical protein
LATSTLLNIGRGSLATGRGRAWAHLIVNVLLAAGPLPAALCAVACSS